MKKQLFLYPINIELIKEGGYFAECRILQGCHAEGDTLGEAIDNLQDVIRVHLEARIKHGDIVPTMSVKKPESLSINLPLPIVAQVSYEQQTARS